jgi:hypothetical protein
MAPAAQGQEEDRRMAGQTAAIRATLEQIRAKVRQQSLEQATASKGKAVGNPQNQAFWDKLALYEGRLRHIIRQLEGREVALSHERNLLWRIPRDLRFSARQSIDSREEVNDDLVELAYLTLRELLEFSGDAASMKAGDWEKIGEKVGEMINKALVKKTVEQLQKGPAYSQANAHPHIGLDMLGPLIGMLLVIIMRKRSPGR